MNKIIWIPLAVIAIILLASAAYYWAYDYSLKETKIEDIKIEIEKAGVEGIILKGEIELRNNGIIPVTIERVEYNILLESGETLSEAKIEGEKIRAGEKAEFPFSAQLNWKPTVKLALEMLQSKETNIIIEAEAKIGITKIKSEKKIDIFEYILQFTKIITNEDKTISPKKQVEEVQKQINSILGGG